MASSHPESQYSFNYSRPSQLLSISPSCQPTYLDAPQMSRGQGSSMSSYSGYSYSGQGFDSSSNTSYAHSYDSSSDDYTTPRGSSPLTQTYPTSPLSEKPEFSQQLFPPFQQSSEDNLLQLDPPKVEPHMLGTFYSFHVTKSDAYHQLLPGYPTSKEFPPRQKSEPILSNGPDGRVKKSHPCHFKDCKATPFTRHYDLERHFRTLHHASAPSSTDLSPSDAYFPAHPLLPSSQNQGFLSRSVPNPAPPAFNPFIQKSLSRSISNPTQTSSNFVSSDLMLNPASSTPTTSKVEIFICDYPGCSHSEDFRKDHCREHYRDFHLEDLVMKNSRKYPRGEMMDEAWWERRQIKDGWWRCTRCLKKSKTDFRQMAKGMERDRDGKNEIGWRCVRCNLPCEMERMKWRRNRVQKQQADVGRGFVTAYADPSGNSEEITDAPYAYDACDNCGWMNGVDENWMKCESCSGENHTGLSGMSVVENGFPSYEVSYSLV